MNFSATSLIVNKIKGVEFIRIRIIHTCFEQFETVQNIYQNQIILHNNIKIERRKMIIIQLNEFLK
jgi:hypothetical protein